MKSLVFIKKRSILFCILLLNNIVCLEQAQAQWSSVPSTNDIYNTLQPGKVGIGTTTPSYTLEVKGSSVPSINLYGSYAATGSQVNIGIATSAGSYSAVAEQGDIVIASKAIGSKNLILSTQNGNSGAIKFTTGASGSDAQRMVITNSGNVGINISNPTNKLELDGEFLMQRIQPGSIKNKFLFNVGWQTNQNTFSITPQTSDGLGWNFNRNFTLDQSGLMTKTIDNSLKTFNIYRSDLSQDVFRIMGDGKVYATELNIKLASQFPDYVFSKTYYLMPLNDLETYIEANKKLPNVPSAVQVETDGINTGEMQRLQMEKIEELTLHLINLNKRMEQLEKENRMLKEKQLLESSSK